MLQITCPRLYPTYDGKYFEFGKHSEDQYWRVSTKALRLLFNVPNPKQLEWIELRFLDTPTDGSHPLSRTYCPEKCVYEIVHPDLGTLRSFKDCGDWLVHKCDFSIQHNKVHLELWYSEDNKSSKFDPYWDTNFPPTFSQSEWF